MAVAGLHRGHPLAIPLERLMIATRRIDPAAVPVVGPSTTVVMTVALRRTRAVAPGARVGVGGTDTKAE
ncbi:hypothetical protein [Mycolicibacterium septicum]|uniref:hypothetical protein n=1 Tax=Mycolicibacterium septicum TaxID=98668 RepID=UPI0031FED074